MWMIMRAVICLPMALLCLAALGYNVSLFYRQKFHGSAQEQSYVLAVPTIACIVIGFLAPSLRPWVYLPILADLGAAALSGGSHRNGSV